MVGKNGSLKRYSVLCSSETRRGTSISRSYITEDIDGMVVRHVM